ncbi:MAG: RNB domain-containing ribonuclease, partial [Nitrosospira sp.]|nr:RNB domain-containing ribonuclease [Nitrosospira sp.]
SQSGGKVKVSTAPSPHQGLGVSQYAWISSPMRRYVDLINQRQLVSLLRKETPFYNKNDDDLPILIRNFEIAYEAYNEFQRNMERYWCLRWLLQEKITITSGVVLKENLVKLNRLPLIIRVPSLPEVQTESYVELEISKIDLLDLTFHAQFIRRLES